MASIPKKGRNSKDGERKESSKRLEDTPSVAENKEESPDNKEDSPVFQEEEETPVVESLPKAPSPEPIYEEPVLTQLIVERWVSYAIIKIKKV